MFAAMKQGEGARNKKVKKKLTSVSFAFTHTYTLEKLTLLLFSPKRTWKILVSFYVRRQHQSIAV